MSWFKKILFYVILILTFAMSFSSEDAKVYMDRKTEPAKLKIGVTKLKTKELEMDFSKEKKLIYAELPENVSDNCIVFVSETLDEMPSLSTTNGRRSINNIKKYLTKDIKVAPKFQYRVVVGDGENGIEEGKRYLVINCKTTLSGVYVYVVEKGSYHVQEVYKGKFNITDSLEERTTYGTIHFNDKHQLGSGGVFEYNGNFLYDGLKVDYVTLQGEYPKKYVNSQITRVRVSIGNEENNEVTVVYKNGVFKTPESGIDALKIKNDKNLGVGILAISSIENSDNLVLKFINLSSQISTNSNIRIEYEKQVDGKFTPVHTDSFKLVIEKNEDQILKPTNGGFYLIQGHGAREVEIKGENITGVDTSKYTLMGIVPTTITKETINQIKESYDEIYLQIKINDKIIDFDKGGFDDKSKYWFWWRGTFNEKWENGKYSLKEGYEIKGEFYDSSAGVIKDQRIAMLNIHSEGFGSPLRFNLWDINRFGNGSVNIVFEYVGKKKKGLIGGIIGTGETKVLKQDSFTISMEGIMENVPEDRDGTLVIYNLKNTRNVVLTSENGGLKNISTDSIGKNFVVETQAYLEGEFPLNFNTDSPDINWGNGKKITISFEPATGSGLSDVGKPTQEFTTNNFTYKPTRMITVKKADNVGRIGVNKTSENLGLRFFKQEDGSTDQVDLWLEKPGDAVNGVLIIRYEADYGKNKVILKRQDVLKVRIEGAQPFDDAEINVSNPIVMYDYYSMNPFNHNKRIHLANNEAQTLDRDGKNFNKNTTIKGAQWIDTKDIKNIPDYDWKNLKNHRVRISSYGGEIVKNTDVNGRTKSSTFVDLSKSENQVVFSYDGGNKYMNFGVSKYNFEGGTGEVRITHYSHTDLGNPVSTVKYTVNIPRFEGRHYVSPKYDIRPREDYIVDYEFDRNIGTGSVEIEYGEVGFKDLDTRITQQSKGEGIEMRVYNDVNLKSIDHKGYIITGARLYFEGTPTPLKKSGTNVQRFIGQNEKSTSAKLILEIPTQEALIPGGKYKIVKANSNDGVLNSESPLEVGVIVGGDDKKFFEYVSDLYINLDDKRLFTTTLTFKNPKLKAELDEWNQKEYTTKAEPWIRLNKSEYPQGVIINYGGDTWGRASDEIIDIPWNEVNNFPEGLEIKILDEKYNLIENQSSFFSGNGGRINFSNGKYINLRINRDSKKSYIEFWCDEYEVGGKGEFYIRYRDNRLKNKEKNGEKGFILTNRIIVNFDKKDDIPIAGVTDVRFSNPAMITQKINVSNVDESFGKIKFSESNNQGSQISVYGNNSTHDAEKWWQINGNTTYATFKDGLSEYRYFLRTALNTDTEFDIKNKIYTFTKEGVTLNVKMNILDNGEPELQVGIENISSYRGERREIKFYIKSDAPEGTGIIISDKFYEINVIIDEFDSTYYGFIAPKNTDITISKKYEKKNYVGLGEKHSLIFAGDTPTLIDLGTSYRAYSKYRGISDLYRIEDMIIEGVSVKVLPKNNLGFEDIIKGNIVFVKRNGKDNVEKVSVENIKDGGLTEKEIPTIYDLKLKLLPEEYRKLEANTEYEIYSLTEGDKDVLKIGFTSQEVPLMRKLQMDKPLNFSTQSSSLEIITNVLDFGQVSLSKEYADANTFLTVKATFANGIVSSPEIVMGELAESIDILKISSEGIPDESKRLKVDSFKLDENIPVPQKKKMEEKEDVKVIEKNYVLSGRLHLLENEKTELGEYEGYLTVTATVIY